MTRPLSALSFAVTLALAVPGVAQTPAPAPSDAPAPPVADAPAPDLALSKEIAKRGLSAVEARLAAVVEPAPEDRFALAGVRFLGAVEAALQARWRVGLSEDVADLPLLRLGLPDNPAPEPLAPSLIRDILAETQARMEAARAPLAGLEDDFGVDIALTDLWFDVNANGARDEGEDMIELAGWMFGIGPATWGETPAEPGPVIRFDTADAAWLTAYTHMIDGFAHMVLAYDPTDHIARVMESREALASFGGEVMNPLGVENSWVDTAAVVLGALKSQPDAAHAAAARDSYLSMIAENRRFWSLVEAETDNLREWIPNARQTSATGRDLPPDTQQVWLALLGEFEAVLNGEALIPHWRSYGGVNVMRMFTEPRPIDIVEWIQGAGAVPYLEAGRMVRQDEMAMFNMMFSGNAMSTAFWLN